MARTQSATRPQIKRSTVSALGSGPLVSGPWKGVFDSNDPFDVDDSLLADALNCYIPDARDGSGIYARNGFGRASGFPPVTPGTPYGQGIYAHHMLDGTVLNFVIVGGKLLRSYSAEGPGVDVTPGGAISINTGVGPIYMTSAIMNIGGVTQTVLIVNDEHARPWIGSNLTSTPITGTYIDYDGAGVAWTAYGQPVVWQGALFFMLKDVGGVGRREDIAWAEPGQPHIGYQQASFDNNMTLVLAGEASTASGPLTALCPTNVALYYFRANSIGAIAGAIDSLTTSHTLDAISFNVGTAVCRTVQQFGNTMFFADNWGRPYMLTPGSAPNPIWKRMVNQVRQWGANGADQMIYHSSAVIEPTRNLYLVTLRRPDPSASLDEGPNTIYVFDALTGNYFGRWTVNDAGLGGIGISCMGILYNIFNEPTVFLLGQLVNSMPDLGYGWLYMIYGGPGYGDWLDNTIFPNVVVTTDRLGENENVRWFVDRVTLTTGNPAACAVGVESPPKAFPDDPALALLGAPAGNGASVDGTYRIVVHPEQYGRGPAVRVWPQRTTAETEQWSLQRITVGATPSLAHPDDL